MKISISLPYKENFSVKYAGAVSLFVNDITSHSKYKNFINVYGNTNFKSKLLKLLQDDELYLKFKHNLIKNRGINKWSDTTNTLLELFKKK